MVLGTKFRIEGTSDIFGKVTVNIKLDGYTGAVIPLDGVGRNWVELKIGDNSNDISNPILPGKLTVQFYVMADFATTELGRSESFTYYVEALDGNDDLIWAGWAIPDEYKEAYHNTPYVATLVASDGLEELKNVNYFVQSGKVVLFDHIQNCLTSTQLDLSFFESINIYSNGMDSNAADSPLKQAQVTYNSFLNISETPNKYDVLRSILQPFLARIYQYRGWRIENILEKRGSYVVREYDSTGAYVDQETFDPLVKFDTDYADYRAFIQKTGLLSIRPSLNNAEVYFNTVEPAEETATGGFQKAEDWTSSTELVEWTAVGSNITIEQVTSSFDGNEFAVKIPGKRSSLEQTNYLESNSYPINSADYETINIEFAHYADYPSIIILGSKPILYFEIIFTETAAADSYNWTGSAWELIPTGQPRKRLRIDFSNRQRWNRYSVSIDRVPADGNIKFRFYKLIKSGSEGVTELRLTAWKSNLVIQEPRNAKILVEYASGQAITTYKGPSFAHIISDGLIVNAAGVMDVDNVLTDEWSRRGVTDELNIRRLFLLQWLSLNATPTELLSGTIHQKGEVITPMSVVKDKDAVSSVRYVMQSWSFSLSNGIGAANYREILLTDTNINAFQDFVDSIRFGDYFSFTTISPIFIFGAPGLSDAANTGPFELPNFTLNGDIRGQLGQSELTPAAIVNKARLDLIGLTASDIVFNAVKDSPDQENMTNLRLIDTYDVLDETFVPYTGAKDDVDLGEQGITTEWVKLNTTPVIPTDQGSLYWDEDDDVLAVVLNGAIQKVGEVTFYNVKNQTGSTIPKGTGVGFAGVVGASARIKVAPFLADGSQPSIYYVGITAEEILNGEDGKVFNFGPIRGLNTSAFNEGDVLYASSTVAGGFTTTPPTAPNNVIVVAAVLTDSATVGALLVRITPADLGHLAVTIGSPANGLSINASTQVLTIGLASASANGALSSTDWSTFNGKEPAITLGTTAQYFRGDKTFQDFATAVRASVLTGYTVGANTALADTDSVLGAFGKVQGQLNAKEAAFTKNTAFNKNFGTAAGTVAEGNDSRFHNPVTLGTPNGLSLSGQALSLGLASTSTNGALSSTDWNTFNNKQNALTNPITGTGVSGQVSFWNGANTQGGDSGLVWDNVNKRLGIGTSSPVTALQVSRNAGSVLRLENTNTGLVENSVVGGVEFYANDDSTNGTGVMGYLTTSSTSPFGNVFKTVLGVSGGGFNNILAFENNGERMRITGAGNVQIGTTTDAGFKLDVNGTARIQGNLTVTATNATGDFATIDGSNIIRRRTAAQVLADIGAVGGTATAGQVSFWNGTTTQAGDSGLTWDNTNKRLGIGTSSPSESLHIVRTGSQAPTFALLQSETGQASLKLLAGSGTTNRAARIDFLNGVSSTTVPRWTLINDFNQNGTNEFNIVASDVTRKIVIFQNGNVGIGTTTDAGFRLDVNGTARVQGNLNVSTGGVTLTGAQTIQTSTGNLTLATAAGNGNIILSPHGTGNVGIGTSSPTNNVGWTTLSLNSGTNGGLLELLKNETRTFLMFNPSGTSDTLLLATTGNGLRFSTNNTERMRITSAGNVGIGTTSPAVRLHAETSGAGLDTVARVIRVNGAENHGINFNVNPDTKVSEIRAFGSTNGALSFATNNAERMRITSAGRLLLGTQTESTFLLDVNGVGRFTNGVRTGSPYDSTPDTWLLGRWQNTIVTPNGAIRVQIGNKYYDIPAIDNGEVPV
jgi:hypothetical protein